jgi:hydroxyethylthiazole kinase
VPAQFPGGRECLDPPEPASPAYVAPSAGGHDAFCVFGVRDAGAQASPSTGSCPEGGRPATLCRPVPQLSGSRSRGRRSPVANVPIRAKVSREGWRVQAPGRWLAAMRAKRPLVMNITNLVAMNFSANVLLAAGASPVMSHAEEEVADMVAHADALVLNIGTLEPAWVDAMHTAARAAAARGIPVVLDPVGAGATPYRTRVAEELLASGHISLIRGNAGELMALAGAEGVVRGVDAAAEADIGDELASWARSRGGVAIATGPVDAATDGSRLARVANGHPLLTRVTATGCSLTSLVGAFVGVAAPDDRLDAAVAALALFGAAGETAAVHAGGPGTFQAALLDALFAMSPEELDAAAHIRWIPKQGRL